MCNICGYITTTDTTEAKNKLLRLLVAGMSRGIDATGFSWIDNGKLDALKIAIPADKFINRATVKTTLASFTMPIIIAHNRQATNGLATNNNNNHPIIIKSGLSLVHNGVIWPTIATNQKKLKSDGLVDSETIIRLVEYYLKKGNKIENAIKKSFLGFTGGGTIALLWEKTPDTLYLVKSTNPLWLAYEKSTKSIFFASTRPILQSGLYQYRWHLGLFPEAVNPGDFIISEATEDTLYIIKQGHPITTAGIARPYNNDSKATGYYDSRGMWHAYAKPTRPNYKPTQPKLLTTGETSPNTPITRPSQYTTACLLSRLSEMRWDVKTDKTLAGKRFLEYTSEWYRILNTLKARNYKKYHQLPKTLEDKPTFVVDDLAYDATETEKISEL